MKLSRKKYEANVPSMAMGDIAFLLLIFFVILARVQDDSHIQWEPARIAELDQAKNSKASVAIDADNKTYLNGREIGVANLAASLSEILGDAEAGHRMVLLKVHKDATATYFEPFIEAISEAGGDLLHVLEDERKKY
ncbi:MAG: biopolymer transporter ExbD [Opitutae bacterium]